jgi:ATP-dependent Clp protease ATP-binding subunit ClpB
MIARQGFDPHYGARPLKRFLQHELETRIGRALVAGEVESGATVRVDADRGRDRIAVSVDAPEPDQGVPGAVSSGGGTS